MSYQRTLSIFIPITMIVGLLSVTGCQTNPSSVFGQPSADPSYAATDAPQQSIPYVREGFAGKTVAVVPYVNKTLSDYRYLGDAAVGILPEYLLEAGFQPIESNSAELDSLLGELDYGQSDRVNPASAAQVGEHLGAKYVFLGEVNNYRVTKPQGSRSISLSGFSLNLGSGSIVYDLQVSGRLVDVETRAIIASKSLSHNETFEVSGGGIQTRWGSFNQDQSVKVEQEVGGKVLATALSRLMTEIVNQLNRRPAR